MKKEILSLLLDFKKGDKLIRNSFFIYLNTAMGSLIGFIFWKIATLRFSNAEIGTAASYVSMATLISLFCELGTSNTLIRFFSEKENNKKLINSTMFLVTASSFFILPIVIVFLKNLFSIFNLLLQNIYFLFIFITLVYSLSINQLLNSIFYAKREAKYAFFKEIVNVSLRLIFIIAVLFAISGDLYILVIWTLANLSALLIGYFILLKRVNVNYPYPAFKISVLKKIFTFSTANYIYRVLNFLPGLFYPTLITEYLDAEQASFFYISWMVSNLFFAIASAVNTSFLAEGTSNITQAKEKIIKAIKLLVFIYSLLLPLLIIISPFILYIFGREYVSATSSFVLLLISAIFVAFNHLFAGTMNILKQTKYIVYIFVTSTTLSIFLPFLFFNRIGLVGFALGWVLAQITSNLFGLVILYINRKKFTEIHKTLKE